MPQHQSWPGENAGPMNIDQLEEIGMNITYNVASIVVMPVEVLLRPWHGTMYYSPAVQLLSLMLMSFAALFFTVADGVTHLIPFVRGAAGMFGMASMTKLFFLASFVHGFRRWRLMLHPEREQVSVWEGDPLPFFRFLPRAESHWFVRIVYEPLLVYALSVVLANLFIIQAPLMLYLQVTAFLLAMKQYIAWYKAWAYARRLLDMANIAPIIARIVEGKASNDDMARVHLASLPKTLPPEIRKATMAHVARAYSVPPREDGKEER
jgi:hypothetical protein